jgi:hypothetical protein
MMQPGVCASVCVVVLRELLVGSVGDRKVYCIKKEGGGESKNVEDVK